MSQWKVRTLVMAVVLCATLATFGVGVSVAQEDQQVPTTADLEWASKLALHKARVADAQANREGFIEQLVVQWAPGLVSEARLLPDVAIVFSRPPWGALGRDTSLALSLD